MAAVSSGQTAAPIAPATLPEPTTLSEIFHLDRATGALTGLEVVKEKTLHVGKQEEFYIEGAASPVAFTPAEQTFVIRLVSWNRDGSDLTLDQVQKAISINRLVVKNVRPLIVAAKPARLISTTDIAFDAQPYGQPTRGLDPKNPNLVARSYRLTPHLILPPGEYKILSLANARHSFQEWAFGLVQP